MTTTEAELEALMRLMESVEDSLRDIQDDWRVMRDGLEEYLLAESDSPSTSASSSAAATPERPGQQKDEKSLQQQPGQCGDGKVNLASRVSCNPSSVSGKFLIQHKRGTKDLENCSTTEMHRVIVLVCMSHLSQILFLIPNVFALVILYICSRLGGKSRGTHNLLITTLDA
ncbi:hypothetical protein IWX90DRAFT_433047 [Phyllosticta citrichinensis]|uniref:Uncharacterized protein n=1 Tax=Phyllosticta citrichinensis TaxID=1130410 RepID=A0ABR1XTA3_9PEZI